jgi:hypothetical protein
MGDSNRTDAELNRFDIVFNLQNIIDKSTLSLFDASKIHGTQRSAVAGFAASSNCSSLCLILSGSHLYDR